MIRKIGTAITYVVVRTSHVRYTEVTVLADKDDYYVVSFDCKRPWPRVVLPNSIPMIIRSYKYYNSYFKYEELRNHVSVYHNEFIYKSYIFTIVVNNDRKKIARVDFFDTDLIS